MRPEMATKPLSLLSISPEQLHANNLVCGRAAVLDSKLYDQNIACSLVAPIKDHTIHCHLTVSIDDQDTVLQLNKSIFSDITIGETLIAPILHKLPESVLMGTLHLIFKNIIKDVEALLKKQITLTKIDWSDRLIKPELSILMLINNQEHHGYLATTSQHHDWIKNIPLNPHNALHKITMPIMLEAGRTRLLSKQVKKLSIQDIVFFEKNWHDEATQFLIKLSDSMMFTASLDNTTVTIIQQVECPMSDDLNDFDEDDDDLDLDDMDDMDDDEHDEDEDNQLSSTNSATDTNNIPIELTFDVGKQTILLGQVSQLAPGFTFELNRDLNNPVLIHANGKLLAEGELINVNGQLGARITKMQ